MKKIGTYDILTDYAIDIVASNVDIYDESGKILFKKNAFLDEHLYGIYSNPKSWKDACDNCELFGGKMAIITSEKEN